MTSHLFNTRSHTGKSPRHRTHLIKTNVQVLGALQGVNHVQNIRSQVELGLCGLVQEQWNRNGMRVYRLLVLSAEPHPQIKI